MNMEVNMENQKKYLSFPQKLAYGSGDFASNFFYMLVSSFVMIYLTDAIGMNPGIIGTLIMISKCLDGFTDVIFGRLIDKTHSKMGKARPWMFYSAFPLALCLILMFMVPTGASSMVQYAYFFIFYTAANALFYTANNISYATLSALITKNDSERVSLGSFRYIFATAAAMIVMSITVLLVGQFGGGTAGWRMVAIIYSVVLIVFNSIAALSCKELPEEEITQGNSGAGTGAESFFDSLKALFTNRYYLLLLAVYLLFYTSNNLGSSINVYYFQYVIGNTEIMGVLSMASMVMMIGLIFNPMLVRKLGMYKVSLVSYIVTTIVNVGLCAAAYAANLPMMIGLSFVRGITMAFLIGSLNALVAEVARNSFLKTGRHNEGMMFSCSSIGIKVGGGIGVAITGWILSAVGYVGTAAEQSAAVIGAIKFIFGALPLILTILITICLFFLNVEKENARLEGRK